jgi:hypothetical protein
VLLLERLSRDDPRHVHLEPVPLRLDVDAEPDALPGGAVGWSVSLGIR